MGKSYIVGIDIGGTNFRIGAVDKEWNTHYFRKVPVGEVFCQEDTLGALTDFLRKYIGQLDGTVEAMAMGLPATLNRERTVLLQAPNIPNMENLPIAAALTESFHIPVYLEKDVSMALYYDKRKYHIPDCEVLVGCYFGTGIGNAIMINGRILAGRNGTAGELGHIPVDGSSLPCGCGNVGCMENLAGGKYLAGLRLERYQDTYIGDIFTVHGSEDELLLFVDRIAMAVATEINILNPDYILIGGGVPAMKDFPQSYLDERIHFHVRKPYPEQELRVIYTQDEENKCVIGAAFYAAERRRD
ncbi:hypothetical protein C806_03393 [Lachnospiraceae bacterium 3-1]|nr:hypothetical protein C806_03393 [Lachnospiraceae bacterium 3-1]